MTKEERLAKQREDRRLNGNVHTKKYEKTMNGYLMRTYRNMLSRVTGVQHKKAHLYAGKEILSKEVFYAFSKSDKGFIHLFDQWERSDYERKLSPSIDRIDTSKGYLLDNIQWITHSENSRKGSLSRYYG